MPVAPPRLCPRCGRLTTGPCGRCARLRDETRGSARARGYTSEWAALARTWLQQFPWCGQRADGQLHVDHSVCAARGARVRARVVDHIQPLSQGGPLLDPANLQSLCTSCNTRKG
jgi:5-methylcytosine-specific restriction endonuclease McrA